MCIRDSSHPIALEKPGCPPEFSRNLKGDANLRVKTFGDVYMRAGVA